jgi:hypothetical protein
LNALEPALEGGSRSDDRSPKTQRVTEMNVDDGSYGTAAYPDLVPLLKKGAHLQTRP